MVVREPAVAGRFYPGTPAEVAADVEALFREAGATSDQAACAVMCPHAGWVYSGRLAAKTLAQVHVPERVVVMCPNHTGRGARIAVMTEGAWKVPGATVPVDTELGRKIVEEAKHIRGARHDEAAHTFEHAIEVLLPLLLARQPRLQLVPIVVGGLDTEECRDLGRAVARALHGVDALVVASSDMNHYLPDAETRRRDRLALDALETGDPARLIDAVDTHDVSMCGVLPAAVMLSYAQERGCKLPKIVGYATSGDAFGDYERVVGYAGVVVPSS
jgi:MEMO1 family protein